MKTIDYTTEDYGLDLQESMFNLEGMLYSSDKEEMKEALGETSRALGMVYGKVEVTNESLRVGAYDIQEDGVYVTEGRPRARQRLQIREVPQVVLRFRSVIFSLESRALNVREATPTIEEIQEWATSLV